LSDVQCLTTDAAQYTAVLTGTVAHSPLMTATTQHNSCTAAAQQRILSVMTILCVVPVSVSRGISQGRSLLSAEALLQRVHCTSPRAREVCKCRRCALADL